MRRPRFHRGYLGYRNPCHVYKMEGIELKQVTEEKNLGMIMDQELKFHHQTESAAALKKANCMLVIIKNSFAVLNILTSPLLFKALVRPLLEYGNVIWGPQYKLDQQALEKVMRRATKLLPQLKDLDYVHRLKALKLSSLQYRKQRGDMIDTLKIITGRVRLDPIQFFTFVTDTSRRGHIYELYKQHAPRRVREPSIDIRIMNAWNNLPRWVVEAEDLDKFKHNMNTHWHARLYLTPFPSCSQ